MTQFRMTAMIDEYPQLLFQVTVIGDNSTGITKRSQVLGRVEAVAGSQAEGADHTITNHGAVRLGGIFDNEQVFLPGQFKEWFHIHRVSEKVHR